MYIAISGNGKIVRTDLNGADATELAGLTGTVALPLFLAFDTPPDMTAGLQNNAVGGIPAGSGFEWRATMYNIGPNPGVFESGQVLFRDYLPAGPTYTVGDTSSYQVTNSGTISCSIASNILTCSETGGTASFAPGWGAAGTTIYALTQDVGSLANPSGGVCQVDPDNVTGDTTLTNNTCSSTVVVNPPSLVRGRSLYISTNGVIVRANLNGTGGTNLGNPGALVRYLAGVTLDTAHDKLYIASYYSSTVIRSNLDGTGGEDLGNPGGLLNLANGIALDVANNRMYVLNAGGNPTRIVTADLNGASGTTLVNLPASVISPGGIALDPVHGRIYVIGINSQNVYRLNLDGSGGTNLGNLGGLLSYPRGIAVDAVNGKLYVASGNSKLVTADLDGNGATDLGNLGGLCPSLLAVALDAGRGRLYSTCASTPNPVVGANLDGTSATSLGTLNGTAFYPIAIALDLRSFINLPLVIR